MAPAPFATTALAHPAGSALDRRRLLAAALVLFAVLWFGGLELRGLFAPDEGRYAEISREMLANGDWVTPRLNDLRYFEKPPLQYWTTAALFALFGEDEWTARLWTALTGFGGALVLVFVAARLGLRREAWLAGLMLASSWGYFLAGQFVTLDMGLTFFLTCALGAFLLAQRTGLDARAERGWMLAAWASMALAVLSKGLVGVVLPGLALAAYVVTARDATVLRRLHLLPGLALFSAIAVPWFLLVQAANPEFFKFFFVQEHFERFALPGHQRPGPWWYFLPIVLVATMPWTPAVIAALARRGKTRSESSCRIDVDRFLLVWPATVLVFFSLSSSKLPPYVLPALPALALLTARRFPRMEDARAAIGLTALAAALAGCAFLIAVPALLRWEKVADLGPLLPAASTWLVAASLALGGGAAGTWLLARAGRARTALVALSATSLVFGQLILAGAHAVDGHYSSERLVEGWLGDPPRLADDTPFYSVGTFDNSLPFYLQRTVTLVEYKGELGAGIAAEPSKYVESITQFKQDWLASPRAYAHLTPALYQQLLAEGLPMRVLARDARRVIVARQ